MAFVIAFILLSTAPAHKCLLLVYSTKLAWHATWRRTKGEATQGTSSSHITTKTTGTRVTGVIITLFSLQVAPKIKALMMECGTTMVGYQPQGDKVNFFRMVVSNHAVTMSDIDFLIDEIERLGHDL